MNNSLSSSSSSTEFELELELEVDALFDRIGGSWIVEGGMTSVSKSDPVPQPISRTLLSAHSYISPLPSRFSFHAIRARSGMREEIDLRIVNERDICEEDRSLTDLTPSFLRTSKAQCRLCIHNLR